MEETLHKFLESLYRTLQNIPSAVTSGMKDGAPGYWDSIVFWQIIFILAAVAAFLIYLFKEELSRNYWLQNDKKTRDQALWEKSEEILPEHLLLNRLNELESSSHRVHSDLMSNSEELTHFLINEGNAYANKHVQQGLQEYLTNLRNLTNFIDEHFWFESEDQTERVTLYPEERNEGRLRKSEKYLQAEKSLYAMIRQTKNSYQKYRDVVKLALG